MNPADNRFARDPDLAPLHEALTHPDAIDDADAAGAAPNVNDPTADPLLPLLDVSMLSPTVQRYVTELLLGGENPAPATRQKLVDAAGRGLRMRRDRRGALPVLLASAREQEGILVSDVANDLHISVQQVYDMESGKTNVRTLGAERIAAWVHAMRVDPAVAVDALRQALLRSIPSRSPQAAARGRSGHVSDLDQQLIDDVTARLGRSDE
jgi:transcriptional regulator with XRE-family HTH domain